MKKLAQNAINMPRSGIRVILDLASTMPDVIHLEIGQPNFPTPQHIIEAAARAAKDGYTGYTPNAGYLSLREFIAKKIRDENQFDVDADQIVVTTGGMGGLYSAFAVLFEAGDEVLLPDPGYPNYEMISILHGIQVTRYPLDPNQNFNPRLSELEQLVSPRTKAILINSPSNPTGAVIPEGIMKGLVEFAEAHDLYIISDECYEKIVFDEVHVSPASLLSPERVISVFSFSKTYAMTGWRVGFVAASKQIAPILAKMQEATVACAPSLSQKAAEAALKGPQECVQEMVRVYQCRRDTTMQILKQHGLHSYTPQGAFYVLIDIHHTNMDSFHFARQLLIEQKVAVAPGATFGPLCEGYIRISLASDDHALKEGLQRICSYIHQYR